MLCVFYYKPLLPFRLADFAVGSDRECDQLLIKLASKEVLQLPDTQGNYAEYAVLNQSVEKEGLSARWLSSKDDIIVPLSN